MASFRAVRHSFRITSSVLSVNSLIGKLLYKFFPWRSSLLSEKLRIKPELSSSSLISSIFMQPVMSFLVLFSRNQSFLTFSKILQILSLRFIFLEIVFQNYIPCFYSLYSSVFSFYSCFIFLFSSLVMNFHFSFNSL